MRCSENNYSFYYWCGAPCFTDFEGDGAIINICPECGAEVRRIA
jgi:hypothetical protein